MSVSVLLFDSSGFFDADMSIAITIKISATELAQLDNEVSIAFKDGSGFIAETAVYHELHCVVGFGPGNISRAKVDHMPRNVFDVT